MCENQNEKLPREMDLCQDKLMNPSVRSKCEHNAHNRGQIYVRRSKINASKFYFAKWIFCDSLRPIQLILMC